VRASCICLGRRRPRPSWDGQSPWGGADASGATLGVATILMGAAVWGHEGLGARHRRWAPPAPSLGSGAYRCPARPSAERARVGARGDAARARGGGRCQGPVRTKSCAPRSWPGPVAHRDRHRACGASPPPPRHVARTGPQGPSRP
jgi:hypothetical protein